MVSQAISHKFRSTASGHPLLDSPSEWELALVDVQVPPNDAVRVQVFLQGRLLEVSIRFDADNIPFVTCEWPRSGAGNYLLETRIGDSIARTEITIRPSKISTESYDRLIEDLEGYLPASIAIGLQTGGALGGLDLIERRASTLSEQVLRLRRAVMGTEDHLGIAAVLPKISEAPHSVLVTDELWVNLDDARRPPPHRFPQAIVRPGNLGEDRLPFQVIDSRVDRSFDVYENRLLKFFIHRLNAKLNVLIRTLGKINKPALLAEATFALEQLDLARRMAPFLDQVRDVPNIPDSVSMVFLKQPYYRAVLNRYIEFQKSFNVTIDEPALDTPITDLPTLYQAWSTLIVIDTLISVGSDLGFRVESEKLFRNEIDDFCIKLIPNGQEALVLVRDDDQARISLTPEPTYGKSGKYQSVSFSQVPDIAITIERSGFPPKIILFDPKYKLESEEVSDENETLPDTEVSSAEVRGKPKKIDIDKMHTYRDSIRTAAGEMVVEYAGILYPGDAQTFSDDVEAIRAIPGDDAEMRQHVAQILISQINDLN